MCVLLTIVSFGTACALVKVLCFSVESDAMVEMRRDLIQNSSVSTNSRTTQRIADESGAPIALTPVAAKECGKRNTSSAFIYS
jgi:hypothetical protein